jgi:hypothetical protein
MNLLLIDDFEFRHRRRLTLIFIEQVLASFLMFLGVNMMFIRLRTHKLLRAHLTIDLTIALTLR